MEKFLPISVQDFVQMITGNFVYVDKTRYVYEMARIPQAYYFLARPRRFGKSLLVSTLKALFEGRKDLFKGLWIENSDWPWKPHPVVEIDFSEIDSTELNNLQDLSMRASYAGLLGYTREELETYFTGWIAEFARRRQTTSDEILQLLQEWYNGHRFSEDALQVYNPYSILNVLTEQKFKPFWFETATPSFLVNLIQEKNYSIPNLENLHVQDATFSTYELENLQLEALLFQTGYLTIHDYDGLLYRLGYPNQEVKTAFLNYIYHRMVKIADTTLKAQFVNLHLYLAQHDLEQFIQTTNAILSAIPYPQIGGQDEGYNHTVFYLMLSASGVLVHTEPLSSHGRMDMAVEFKDKVFIVELKCNQSAAAAIQQIHDKRYYDKYVQSGRKIYLLGINFSTKERAITDWRMEALTS